MFKKLQKRNSEGFTIIEVMIVLAIAALILLIVFLAVPALQRNSRNTQRKSDVGRVGSAATTVVSNNNGSVAALTSANLQSEVGTGKLAYYTTTNVTAHAPLTTGQTYNNGTTIDTVVVVPNAKCNGVNSTYNNRAIAVLYSTEGGGGGATRICADE